MSTAPTTAKVEFYRHGLGDAEIEAVAEVLRSTFLTTGPVTGRFEAAFAERLGVRHAVGMSSWTTGAFLVLKALGIGPGDEVITTPLTFIATANAVLHAGATPVFVDVRPDTGNLDEDRVEAAITDRTRAILPVHLYGQMVDMRRLRAIADARGLYLIEDAAHCIEGRRDGYGPGRLGHAAAFSFYATKNLACGEGGAVATDDEALADRLHVLRLHGMDRGAADRYTASYRHWDMVELGWKANMFDIQAALLLAQLDRLDAMLERREAVARTYEAAFEGMAGVDFPRVLDGSVSARHLFTIWVDPRLRDAVLAGLQQRGIGVAVNYRAIHLLTYYRERFGYERGAFPIAERIGGSTITLPLYPSLTAAETERVIEAVEESVREAARADAGAGR